MNDDPRKDFLVRLAHGVRLAGQGNENVTLEEEGSVVRLKGILMHDLGFFTFYVPTPLALPENRIISVEENGRRIFPL